MWRLKGVTVEALRALDDGEWLEILDDQARSRASARVIDTHPSAGTLIVGVRAASDPPRTGFVRPLLGRYRTVRLPKDVHVRCTAHCLFESSRSAKVLTEHGQ